MKFDFSKLELRYEDKSVRMTNLADAAGVTIPVGGKLIMIYDYPETEYPEGMEIIGEHEVSIKYSVAGQEGEITAKRALLEERHCLKYPPEV